MERRWICVRSLCGALAHRHARRPLRENSVDGRKMETVDLKLVLLGEQLPARRTPDAA